MLTTTIGNMIQEKFESLDPKKKLSYVKAFLLGSLQGLIDFFEWIGIAFFCICVYATYLAKKENKEED